MVRVKKTRRVLTKKNRQWRVPARKLEHQPDDWIAKALGPTLELALRKLEDRAVLPKEVGQHPWALSDLVLACWQPEGRKKDPTAVSHDEIARRIAEKIKSHFDRNRFYPIFRGRRLNGLFYRQPYSRDEIKAFLEVAFELWKDGPSSYDPPIDVGKVVENAAEALFARDWMGTNTDLTPVIGALVASGHSPILLGDIEFLLDQGIHHEKSLTPERVEELLAQKGK